MIMSTAHNDLVAFLWRASQRAAGRAAADAVPGFALGATTLADAGIEDDAASEPPRTTAPGIRSDSRRMHMRGSLSFGPEWLNRGSRPPIPSLESKNGSVQPFT